MVFSWAPPTIRRVMTCVIRIRSGDQGGGGCSFGGSALSDSSLGTSDVVAVPSPRRALTRGDFREAGIDLWLAGKNLLEIQVMLPGGIVFIVPQAGHGQQQFHVGIV